MAARAAQNEMILKRPRKMVMKRVLRRTMRKVPKVPHRLTALDASLVFGPCCFSVVWQASPRRMPKQPRARSSETKSIQSGGGADVFVGGEDHGHLHPTAETHFEGILLSSCCPLLAGGGGSRKLTLRVQGAQ